ncbi:MAG: DUF4364 family protein [Firmicutes bacterium]|nr:DUF4364 family protein [Bacillota bacterium]
MEPASLDTLNKLILLFVFDKMDMPMTDATVVQLTTSLNTWLSYMDCQHTIGYLIETNMLHRTRHEDNNYYSLTPDGRMCISHFYEKLPQELREEIADFVKKNRMLLRRNQEYYRHYYKNPDGTYTVELKIIDPAQTTLEIRLNAENRSTAKQAYEKWEEKAASIYYHIHEQLME